MFCDRLQQGGWRMHKDAVPSMFIPAEVECVHFVTWAAAYQLRHLSCLIPCTLHLPCCSPAVAQLHSYAWWRAEGDGVDEGLFYAPTAESQLTTLSQVRACAAQRCAIVGAWR